MTTVRLELPPELAAKLDAIETRLAELQRGFEAESEWLTTQEAAAFLRVSPDTLRRRVKEGRIKAYRPGGKNMRFKRSDLSQAA